MKTSVAGLLDVLPRVGDDGGRGNDDDEHDHRASIQARFRAKEEEGFGEKRRGMDEDKQGRGTGVSLMPSAAPVVPRFRPAAGEHALGNGACEKEREEGERGWLGWAMPLCT